jgi:hypothetical protein
MNRAALLKMLLIMAVSIALVGAPQSSLAQRGGFHGGSGFGGGGGFHGGGFNGGGFHGGSSFGRGSFGGFRGGNFGGFGGGGFSRFGGRGFDHFHGGFRGFRGDRFFGFGGFPGWGWGLDIDFGFWPYWGGYPYFYGYGPWWGPYAYYYPYDPYPDDRDYRPCDGCNPDYRHSPDDRRNPRSPNDSRPNDNTAPAKPSNSTVPESSADPNYVMTLVGYGTVVSKDGTVPTADGARKHEPADFSGQQLSSGLRPVVRNVIQALRAMPPEARQQRLNSGRYDSFSPEERELLISATQRP